MRVKVTLKERIKKHFENSEWQHVFVWNDGKQYGDKYETIKSLSKIFDCPYTSLYIPVKELAKEGFITYSQGFITYSQWLISYEREILNSDPPHPLKK